LNLNGDYISDALAAMVGGMELHQVPTLIMSMALQIFEATHGLHPNMQASTK
jgi:isocitrate dehydrogenase